MGIGHNSISGEQLKQYVERIERMTVEKQDVADNIRDAFAEAKANGFDVKVLRQVLKLRKLDPDKRQEEEYILDTYLNALGMTPLEQHIRDAQERAAGDDTKLEDDAAGRQYRAVSLTKQIIEQLSFIYQHGGVFKAFTEADIKAAKALVELGLLHDGDGLYPLTKKALDQIPPELRGGDTKTAEFETSIERGKTTVSIELPDGTKTAPITIDEFEKRAKAASKAIRGVGKQFQQEQKVRK